VNHIIAKDIVKPHGIFWPTILKAAEIEPYLHLNVHGYWNMEDAKMSKSLGNVVRPADLLSKYGNDQSRYFFLREMTFGLDAKFSEDAVISRINFDLANDFGNLVNRTFNMAEKFFGGNVPARSTDVAGLTELKTGLSAAMDGYYAHIDAFQFSFGIEKLMEFVRSLNKYIDERKPWALAKEGKNDELASVMRNLLESIYSISVLLSPALITASPKIASALGADTAPKDLETLRTLTSLSDGKTFSQPGILFPRMEKSVVEEKPAEAKAAPEQDNLIEIGDFAKVDLRVVKIVHAERVEGSDKLLRLKVSTGDGERQVVAGIGMAYKPEDIAGKKIILVANLKPAVIFKQKSEGMLLAAKKNKNDLPVLVIVDDAIPEGARLG